MKKSLLLSFFFALALVLQAYAQGRTVTGRVTSAADGSPLPGVSVVVKGTTTGTGTDADGRYSLEVPATGATLVFSYLGFDAQEVAVGNQSTINATLSQATTNLSEVVVTGYGVQEKREVTGSIASIGAEALEGLPTQTFDKAIQGRAAGVQVTSASGQPGGGVVINIRGTSTINGSSDPLYVIDGVQVSPGGLSGLTSANVLSSINPADIESIEILKDAAAASIYGSQAANGVVIVTTKRGKSGKTKIRLSAQRGFSEMYNPYDLVSGSDYVMLRQEAYGNYYQRLGLPYATGVSAANEDIFGEGVTEAPADITSEDWYNAISRTGSVQQYELSASGGDEKTRFFISGSYNGTEGTIFSSDYKRGTIRANLDHKITDKLSVETTLGLTGSKATGPTTTRGFFTNTPFTGALFTPPVNSVYNEDGTFNNSLYGGYGLNIVQSLLEESREAAIAQTVSTMALNYDIIPGLRARILGGIDFSDAKDYNYRPSTIPIYGGGTGSETFRRNINWTTTGTLNYNKDINEVHSIGVLGGLEYRQVNNTSLFAMASNFATPRLRLISQGATPAPPSSTFTGYKTASAFSNFKYDYKDKYLVSATLRYDGSSRFGANNKYGLFYGLSAGWRVSEEAFMDGLTFISDLKLRASYGVVGSQPENNFQSLGLFGGGGQYLNIPALSTFQLPNPDFTWEEAAMINLGLDYAFFNNRVYGSVDVYKRNNTNLILSRELPADAGYTGIIENGGEVESKGLDFEISTVNIDNGGFNWTTSFNIGFAENEIVSLNEGRERIGNTYIVGEPLRTIWTYKWAGVNPADGRPMYYDAAGNITYSPANADQGIVGDMNPDFFGGLTNNISFKGLTLDVLFQYQYGNEAYLQTGQVLEGAGSGLDNQTRNQLDRWTTPGQITWVPRPFLGEIEPGGYYHTNLSSRWVEDASYIRLKQASLNYRIPTAFTDRFNVPTVSLFVQGVNLVTFTNYRGDDPENTGNNLNGYPNPRTVTGGVTLEF